ncbi:MAG: hypothetical protein QF464_16660 [Myxococcota bacterium]|nr:hypothetical protein [Myxococcota bacterium]
MTRWLLTVALATSCAKPVPAHLALTTAGDASDATRPLQSLDDTLAFMINADPLARRPVFPVNSQLSDEADYGTVVAFITAIRNLEGGRGERMGTLHRLHREYAGTPVSPLVRGYALSVAERPLAQPDPLEDELVEALSLLTGLPPGPEEAPTQARHPFDWLGGGDDPRQVRAYADRWVLSGWLDAPNIPVHAAAEGLGGPQYALLSESPTARLILARAASADADPSPAWDDLAHATLLSLTRAAADTDAELGAWADQKADEAEALGANPVKVLLDRAFEGLIADAASDRSAGAALLVIQAHRWGGTCAWTPCEGVDRSAAMTAAGRWHPEVRTLARVWQVIALKDALDSMDVGHDTVLFPKAMTLLIDALNGLGAGPLDVRLLRWNRPDPSAWEALGVAVGREATTDWDTVNLGLGGFLQDEARAVAKATEDPEMKSLLERIATRALK